MSIQPFCHLHVHDTYSLLDGFGKPEDYAKRASELGFQFLAITNHGNCDSAIKFQNACKEANIIPIIGQEFYITEDAAIKEKGDKRAHITVLAKNEEGFQNILKMTTIANIDGFYYRPRIDPSILLKHIEGLIVMTGCSETFLHYPWGLNLFEELKQRIPGLLYLEIMPHDFDKQKETNQLCDYLCHKTGVPLVCSNDAHYVYPEDAKAHEVLLAIQTKSKWSDKKRWKFTGDSYYLKSYREMIRGFKEQAVIPDGIYQEALRNTMEIAEKCSGFQKIEKKTISLPTVPKFIWETDEKILNKLCFEGFSDKIIITGKNEELYRERMWHELDLIKEKGFAKYFLIVWELIQWCKENDVMTGPGRGSSSGSLVCYLLGITLPDPLEYNLLFERFLSLERFDYPDIDIDFEDVKKPLIRKHLEELYGKWNVAAVSTFSEMKGKSAVRDVSRVFDIPLKEVNIFCKVIEDKLKGEEGYGATISSAINEFDEGREFHKKFPEICDISIATEGVSKNRGQHAAAVVISDEDLRNGTRCSFALGKDKEPIINWDKEDIEYMGLMKLDILGLSTLSVLNFTKKLIKENHGIDIKFEDLDLRNPKCFEELSKGNNVGCFQVGTQGQREFCQDLGIDNFEMLVHATSLYRPGALKSGLSNDFVNRKRGTEPVHYIHPLVEGITRDTYGIILYQEQLMQMVIELAGMSWATANKIRKVVAKSKGEEAFLKYQGEFVQGCLGKGTLSETQASMLWNELAAMGGYAFTKGHAVPYSMITYYCMWSKLNYPAEFICALLTCGTEDEDKKNEYIAEAFRLGIEIRPPKIGISDPTLWIIRNGILYAPFTEIKGIGEKTAIAFQNIKEGQGFYESGKSKRKIPDKFMKILDEIKAYDDVPVRDEEAEHISEYLSISIMKGVMGRYAKLYNLLSDVVTDTEFIDLVTNRENDLISGNISNLPLNLMKPVKRFRNKDILECQDCELRKECKAPVLPTIGNYNIMIIGESPGKFEDKQGRGFIHDSGDILWYELGLYGHLREDFQITNVCKCYPGRTIKNPTRKHVDRCRKWLDEELRSINPFVVLALGNANIKFFTDNDTGIINKSGTTEWNEKYGCWVCFCLHPVSTIYASENKELFKEGIKNFCEKIKNLGQIPF
jgi:DNA polymerase-3 subunit alpha